MLSGPSLLNSSIEHISPDDNRPPLFSEPAGMDGRTAAAAFEISHGRLSARSYVLASLQHQCPCIQQTSLSIERIFPWPPLANPQTPNCASA
jgi:hypothetical protein